jgi:hypothetical protein
VSRYPSIKLPGLLDEYFFGDPLDPKHRMSPDNKTGGSVPLPSFDDEGGYFPPTGVPFNPRMPRNTLMPEKPIDRKRLGELIKKIKGAKVPEFPSEFPRKEQI